MRRNIIFFFLAVAALLPFGAVAQLTGTAEPLFEYPQVPDKLTKINMRSNFMVEHLWDKCKLDKENITNLESFHETFTDYLSFFVLADREVVVKSVEKYVEKVAKNANNLNLTIGMLNAEVLNIRAQYCSDDVYQMFATCLIDNKHVPKEMKEMLEANVRMLANSTVGAAMSDIPLRKSPVGASSLNGLSSEFTLLFFNSDGCVDCSIYKVRLSANLSANRLIDSGVLAVVSVYPDGLSDPKMDSEAQNWNVATLPGYRTDYDMRIQPAVYLLDKDKKIVDKFFTADDLFQLLEGIEYSKNNNQ